MQSDAGSSVSLPLKARLKYSELVPAQATFQSRQMGGPLGMQLCGKTLGIIGTGAIGARLPSSILRHFNLCFPICCISLSLRWFAVVTCILSFDLTSNPKVLLQFTAFVLLTPGHHWHGCYRWTHPPAHLHCLHLSSRRAQNADSVLQSEQQARVVCSQLVAKKFACRYPEGALSAGGWA